MSLFLILLNEKEVAKLFLVLKCISVVLSSFLLAAEYLKIFYLLLLFAVMLQDENFISFFPATSILLFSKRCGSVT